jgi:hypothetical protein
VGRIYSKQEIDLMHRNPNQTMDLISLPNIRKLVVKRINFRHMNPDPTEDRSYTRMSIRQHIDLVHMNLAREYIIMLHRIGLIEAKWT